MREGLNSQFSREIFITSLRYINYREKRYLKRKKCIPLMNKNDLKV